VARATRQPEKQGIKQPVLFTTPGLHTVVISHRQDFENLFEGFAKLEAISYVISVDLLLDFFDRRGYAEVEVLVGENLAASYRRDLEGKDIEVTERLAERVENGTLRIFIPDRTIHTKLYILEGHDLARVIVSSANLTETAREAARQVNYAWYADLTPDDPLLRQVRQDYQSHLKRCSLFMDDLRELLRERGDVERRQLIAVWLKGVPVEEEDPEVKRILHEISTHALQPPDLRKEPIISVRLPEAPATKKRVERLLEPLHPSTTRNELQLNGPAFIRYVQENYRFPLMRVDLEQEQILLGINGSVVSLTQALPDSSEVNRALQHIEDYVNTVDIGQALDPNFAKTSMFEALLYVLSAPFANEQMRDRRRRYGVIERRGPRFLYIYGPAQNGKSTFLSFALKLLTEQIIQPLSGSDFAKTRLFTANSLGTVFPLVFDDVIPSQRPQVFEEVLKSYWEVWWKEDYVSPQIIMSSNTARLQEWAKSRVKRVDFDVHFAPNENNKETLAQLFTAENHLFRWFSYLYFRYLKNPGRPSDDELYLARNILRQLYEYAQRPLPECFPQQPIETLYDPGCRDWNDILKLNKARIAEDRGRLLIKFSEDVQHWEIREYQNYLPQTVKCRRRGNTLIVESPGEFKAWLEGQTRRRRSWLARLPSLFRR